MTVNVSQTRYEKVPLIKTDVPGSNSKKLLEKQRALETHSVIYPQSFPIAIKRAVNSAIEDVDGNVYIDWFTGISVLNLGYSNLIRNAVFEQILDIWHTLEIPTEIRISFMESLKHSFPQAMRTYKTMFGVTGAEACETAINIAHTVSGKKASTLVFKGAYHGVSGGIISATSNEKYRAPVHSIGFDVIRVPYPNSLISKENVLAILEKIMKDSNYKNNPPDSLLVEPVQGEGGYIIPPDGFLRDLRKFCDDYNLILIVDEVQSGMGRTGKMWAFEWDSIIPDIVCVSKSVGGGMPLSLVYYRNEFDEKLPTPFHLGTYRGNTAALAAGKVVLDTIPQYLDRVSRDGKTLLNRFSEIDSDIIGQVRGKGFMIGIELLENNVPLKYSKTLEIKHKLMKSGLLMHTCGYYSNVFRYMAALNIPDAYNERGLSIFEKVLLER